MKNRIVKNENGYLLICENGEKFECKRIYEKKSGKFWIKLPKENPSGREFISELKLENINEFEFESKENRREGIGSGGWKSKMTEEERKMVEDAENLIEKIKKDCMMRKKEKLDPNSIEGIQENIKKLQEKLAKMMA